MWNVVPTSIVLVGLLGFLVLGFGLARITWLELALHRSQRPAEHVAVPTPADLPGFRAAA